MRLRGGSRLPGNIRACRYCLFESLKNLGSPKREIANNRTGIVPQARKQINSRSPPAPDIEWRKFQRTAKLILSSDYFHSRQNRT